jgi:AcrR family transcriptional regulator
VDDHSAAPRRRSERRSPDERRPEILDAALHVFDTHGFRDASMNAIADAAGVTKPVIYACFPSKEELFTALLDREEQRVMRAVMAAFPAMASDATAEELLVEGLRALLTVVAESPQSWRAVFLQPFGGDLDIAERARRGRAQNMEYLAGFIETYFRGQGVEEAPRKARVFAHVVAGTLDEAARLLIAGEDGWTPQELAECCGAILARGEAGLH